MSLAHELEFPQDDLESMLAARERGPIDWIEPTQYDLAETEDRYIVTNRLRDGRIRTVVDGIDMIAGELFEVDYPRQKDDEVARAEYIANVKERGAAFGKWFEFHEDGQLVRYPDVDDHRRLHTARYKNVITGEEQDGLYDSTLAVYGLSVGSSVVDALSLSGIGGKYVMGDFDTLAPTNLGRFRAGFEEVGNNKLDVVARKISRIDPYVEQVHQRQGFTEDAIDELIANNPNVMFDEVDSMTAKALMRVVAMRHKIPLIMATDLGDRSVLDVERYDLDDGAKPFQGKLSTAEVEALAAGRMSPEDMQKLPAKILGLRHVTTRMLQSVMEIGKTVPGMPQLGSTATMGGVLASTAAREIILGNKMGSGRYVLNPKQTLDLAPQASVPEALRTVAAFARSQKK